MDNIYIALVVFGAATLLTIDIMGWIKLAKLKKELKRLKLQSEKLNELMDHCYKYKDLPDRGYSLLSEEQKELYQKAVSGNIK